MEEQLTYRENIKEKLDAILEQTQKTNGRVSSLERWQSYVLGFCGAVTLFLVPVLLTLMKNSL